MTKSSINPKASHRVFAALIAMMLIVLCFSNIGVISASAASGTSGSSSSDIPKRAAPVLASFDRNYLNYYNTINKRVAASQYIDTPREAVMEYLNISNISYVLCRGDDWNFDIQLRDFICSVKSGTSTYQGASISLIDRTGFEAINVSRVGAQAKIQSNDGLVVPWTKNLSVTSGQAKSKAFTMRDGEYTALSTDIAMIITTIGGFYGSKTNAVGQKTGVKNNTDLAAYIGDYLTEHRNDAEAVRNSIINLAKTKDGKITEADFVHYYASGQPNKNFVYTTSYPNGYIPGQGISYVGATWDISPFLSMKHPAEPGQDFLIGTSKLWPADRNMRFDANITNGTKIEIRYGGEVIETVTWYRPSTQLDLELLYGESAFGCSGCSNTDTLTLGIMIDRALYEFARAEGLL